MWRPPRYRAGTENRSWPLLTPAPDDTLKRPSPSAGRVRLMLVDAGPCNGRDRSRSLNARRQRGGIALSRLKHGFEPRWGHHSDFVEVFRERFPCRVGRDGNL